MKNCIVILIQLLCFVPFASKARWRDSTEKHTMFSLELLGTSRFYDLHSVDKFRYRRNNFGLSCGIFIRIPLSKRFYINFGTFYSRSSFSWDTSGIFASKGTFPAPLALKKWFTYVDKVILVGKDFNVYRNKVLAGVSIGLANGSLIQGKGYCQGSYQTPISVFDNLDPQFSAHVGSLLFNWNFSYQLSPYFSMHANVYNRWYGTIDESNPDNYNKTTGHPKIFGERLWNYGLGIQYNFLATEKVKKWGKKKGS